LSQQVFQRFQKEDSNRSGGLDLNEVQKKIDATGSSQDLLDNFDSIDADQSGELSTTELIAFRVRAGEGQEKGRANSCANWKPFSSTRAFPPTASLTS